MPLPKYVQSPDVELSSAYRYASDVIETLQVLSDDIGAGLHKLFESASKMHELYFNAELNLPCLVGRQTSRENYPYGSVEEYYRRSINFHPIIR